MKSKLALLVLAAPALFGAVVVFHPGAAFAVTPLAQGAATTLVAGTYTVDPMHTSVGFDVGHMGLSLVQGRFTDVSGKLVVDPKQVGKSSVTFRIGTESVDTAVAPRNAHLKTKDFFDVATYPDIVFASTKIEKKGKGYLATGNLTLHGTTREIQIPFKAYGPVVTPEAGTRVGIVAEPITLSRAAYGIPYNAMIPDGKTPMVSDDVTVRLSLEATLDK
jgi:polyisoprenoid-binding protein YceI